MEIRSPERIGIGMMIGLRYRSVSRAPWRWIPFPRFVVAAVSLMLVGALSSAKLDAQIAPQTSHRTTVMVPDLAVDQQAPARSVQATDLSLANDTAMITRGELPAAEKSLRSYLTAHAESADAHFLLGYVLYREVKPTESLAEQRIARRRRYLRFRGLSHRVG
jgi:hypothetical protein